MSFKMIYYFNHKEIKWRKVEELSVNFHDKKEYFTQPLNYGLVLKKVNRVIKFNQEVWIKSSIDKNTELKKFKNWFQERFFQVDE